MLPVAHIEQSRLYFFFEQQPVQPAMQSSISHDTQPCSPETEALHPSVAARFEVRAKIGSGAYGHVWKVRCLQSGKTLALKKVFLAFQNEVDAQRVYREVSLLRRMKHDNVVRLREVVPVAESKDIYLLFDHLESDLFRAIKNRVLELTHKKYIVYQLACALKYLHSAGVVHRDLKPSNVLLNSSCHVVLCDFGLSRTLASPDFAKPLMTEFIATRWYRAPQVLLGSRSYADKSDMWSLGCLIYELYSRRTLLPGENTIDQITKMLEFKGRPTPQELASFKAPKAQEILSFFQFEKQSKAYYYQDLEEPEVRAVLENLFHYDPARRWSAAQLLECDFLKQFRHSLAQDSALAAITLPLNDNQRYRIDKYRDMLLKPQQATQRVNPFVRNSHKRQPKSHHSHRVDSHSGYSLGARVEASLKKGTALNSAVHRRLIQANKKFQSAHVSPSRDNSVQEGKKTLPLAKKMRLSDRIRAAYLPLGRKPSESKVMKASQNSFMALKRSSRKSSDIKLPKKGKYDRTTKENSSQVMERKTLKRTKMGPERLPRTSHQIS